MPDFTNYTSSQQDGTVSNIFLQNYGDLSMDNLPRDCEAGSYELFKSKLKSHREFLIAMFCKLGNSWKQAFMNKANFNLG